MSWGDMGGAGQQGELPTGEREAKRPGRAREACEQDSAPICKHFWAAHRAECLSSCVQFILASAPETRLPTGESAGLSAHVDF